ncbi:hypothetical protein H9P43_008730 [Blastocladiella emersonii ATCC 22665]|nr:hypothetical protein H9P43_008730 [Blastocladiella emersonii ATCC 22665]
MPVTLNAPELIERVLCHAARSIDPDDINGFLRLGRVLPMSRIPCVHRIIMQRFDGQSFERAMSAGHTGLLNKWRDSGLPLPFNTDVLRRADLRALEWVRDEGIDVNRFLVGQHWCDRVRAALGIGQRYFCDYREKWIESEERYVPDAAVFAAVDVVAAGTQTELAIEHQPITDEGIKALNAAMASPMQALTSLSLCGSTINCMRLLQLKFPATLKSLNLAHSWSLNLDTMFLGDEAALEIVKNLPPTVTKLNLAWNKITGTGLAAICPHLPPALESLTMDLNQLGAAGSRTKLKWSFPATVTELRFEECNLQTNGSRGLTDAMPPNLHTLWLANAGISQGGAKILLPALPASLRVLNFSENPECSAPITKNLLARSLPAQLERLTLKCMGLHDTFPAYLFQRLPRTLKHLDVSQSSICTPGLVALSHWIPPTLEYLNLTYAAVKNSGLRVLFPKLPATLRELDLSDNFRVKDETLLMLAENMPPALEKLVLRATHVTDVGVQAVRNAAPASLAEIVLPVDGDVEKYAEAVQMIASGQMFDND